MENRVEYYNEFDPDAAAWLRDLIKAGLLPEGDVDERSITEVRPEDLKRYHRCHFFAGIGLWPLSLRLAGFPDDQPVWTGSCPCQPFSSAGKQEGTEDPRHLWPTWYGLIRECHPPVVFGEQVAAAIGHGWLDLVQSDLEREGYSLGKAVLGAASVGAPHIRQRLYFVANSEEHRIRSFDRQSRPSIRQEESVGGHSVLDALADHKGTEQPRSESETGRSLGCGESSRGVAQGDTGGQGLEGHGRLVNQHGAIRWEGAQRYQPTKGFWGDSDWVYCRDDKFRPVEPSTFPLAHGLPVSMGRMPSELQRLAEVAGLSKQSLKSAKQFRKSALRGYGNAIVPQVAAEFIAAYLETRISE